MATNPLLARLADPQISSPLFNRIPPEMRHQIFTLALSSFPAPEPEKRYDTTTCYTRPSYFAPTKSDVRLLRTCRAIYSEAWYLPFLLREQIHWLTSNDRAPPEYNRGYEIIKLGNRLHDVEGVLGEKMEIKSLRVFAQMYALEDGWLEQLLGIEGLHPRSVTLTIRHADWWWWEQNHPLYIRSEWVQRACKVLSPSVRELRIELESLERKKSQIDRIVQQVTERWYWKRKDDVSLFPDATGKANTVNWWTGTSTWHNRTWGRDESRPGEIDYYVATVVFRPEGVVRRSGGQVSPLLLQRAKAGDWISEKILGVEASHNDDPEEVEDDSDDDVGSDSGELENDLEGLGDGESESDW